MAHHDAIGGLSDGVLTVDAPPARTIEHDWPWAEGVFSHDRAAALAHDENTPVLS